MMVERTRVKRTLLSRSSLGSVPKAVRMLHGRIRSTMRSVSPFWNASLSRRRRRNIPTPISRKSLPWSSRRPRISITSP